MHLNVLRLRCWSTRTRDLQELMSTYVGFQGEFVSRGTSGRSINSLICSSSLCQMVLEWTLPKLPSDGSFSPWSVTRTYSRRPNKRSIASPKGAGFQISPSEHASTWMLVTPFLIPRKRAIVTIRKRSYQRVPSMAKCSTGWSPPPIQRGRRLPRWVCVEDSEREDVNQIL